MGIRLGVNIDHVATLRNARNEGHPDLLKAAKIAISAGADGITAHLREDRRHIRDEDIDLLKKNLSVPLNLEMAITAEMVSIAVDVKPNACCIVPERREELTTEGGLDIAAVKGALKDYIPVLKQARIRVSLFVAPELKQLELAAALGADIVELHTGAYAHAPMCELPSLIQAAQIARQLGLEVHAGHGLTFDNVMAVAGIPEIKELNIGHFLIGQAIFDGLGETVKTMKQLIEEGSRKAQHKAGKEL